MSSTLGNASTQYKQGFVTQSGGYVSAYDLSFAACSYTGTTSTYTDSYSLNGGTLSVRNVNMGAPTAKWTPTFNLGGGDLRFTNGSACTVGTMATSGASTIDTQTYSPSMLTIFSGTGSITKVGSGTLTLSGDQHASAKTFVVGVGTLAATAASNFAGQDIQVANGATYQVVVSPTTQTSLYSRLATTDPSPNALSLGGAIINQDIYYDLAGATVTSQWRARTAPEVSLLLGSDVMSLGGLTASTPYVVQMGYSPAVLPSAAAVGYNPSDSIWVNATNGNTGNNATDGELGYVGSFAAFQAWVGDQVLTDYIGAYGYDPVADKAWAVLNQAGTAGTYAVIPEPGTLAMLAVCALGLVAWGWRKRK